MPSHQQFPSRYAGRALCAAISNPGDISRKRALLQRPCAVRIAATCLGYLGVWVRLLYVYPYPHVDRVLPLMADGRILPYLDIPFQHAGPRVLKAMRRPAHQEKTLQRLAHWRAQCPELAVRSTFIVGFPGETDEDFADLLDWLTAARLARVGCFKYEDVDGAPANALPDQVPAAVKEERYALLMAHQQAISAEVLVAVSVKRWRSLWTTSTRKASSRALTGTHRISTAMSISTTPRGFGQAIG